MVLAVTALWTLFPLVSTAGVAGVAAAIAVLTAVAFRRRVPHAAALGVFCTACFGAMLCGIRFSQIWLAFGLAACVAAARLVPWMRGTSGWLRAGAFGRDMQALCVASAAIAAAALLLWFTLLQPDVADLVAQFFPAVAPFWILVGGVLFAAVNAAVEEGAYRGVVMYALEAQVGKPAALLMQAVAFGTLHINGFPRGPVGVALAVCWRPGPPTSVSTSSSWRSWWAWRADRPKKRLALDPAETSA